MTLSIALLLLSLLLPCKNVNASPAIIPEMTDEELELLHSVSVAEAEDQGIGGICFVMQVVFNRVENPDFPDTVGGSAKTG